MRKVAVILACVVVLAAACGGDDDEPAPAGPSPTPTFAVATAIVESEGEPVLLTVEVAETPEQHQFGLMFRESLPDDSGMAFVFFEDTSGGFWMKDTLIPLSIAYFDVEGEILRILDMEPCESEPCKIYDPGVTYRGALEVNQGAFDEWGISEGDTITIRR